MSVAIRRPLATLVLLAVAALSGCAANAEPEPTDRALTTEEAQRLAIARFTNYDEGVREIDAEVPGQQPVHLTGWVDFAAHRGYVAVGESDETVGEFGLFAWTRDFVAARDGAVDAAELPPPADGWQTGPLDPAASALQNLFTVALSLGADRPDNPTLLQQSDARWLRDDELDGTEVDVIAGPSSDEPASASAAPTESPVRYWIDERGRLLRVELRQRGSDEWSVLDLGADAEVDLAPVETLGGTGG
ncbi:hypothetical protein CLV46_2813 [Diaminobutyricimonas aerilata]|uniref:Lipoprotein n=1 Tax=Diaminobutyricimonas aerilata TaxID=1162967 RepID=A0A2M9CMV2_9MICO|nr:hypothetical protein [Diaminobutyricimonas aerilata]PJJ73227.1 hypothetical protein CLV46_2813 [Diaminobutyricimonas aerilata]